MDCSPPGSSVHGILQARILEWVAMPSSRGSSQSRDRTQVSRIAGGFFTIWITREALPLNWPLLFEQPHMEGHAGSSATCAVLLLLLHSFHGRCLVRRLQGFCVGRHSSMRHGLTKCKTGRWLYLRPNAYTWGSCPWTQTCLSCLDGCLDYTSDTSTAYLVPRTSIYLTLTCFTQFLFVSWTESWTRILDLGLPAFLFCLPSPHSISTSEIPAPASVHHGILESHAVMPVLPTVTAGLPFYFGNLAVTWLNKRSLLIYAVMASRLLVTNFKLQSQEIH